MTRFFISPEEMISDHVILSGENATHAKVLRLKPGENILICDGQGNECICSVVDLSDGKLKVNVLKRQNSSSEAAIKASVYVAFPKSDKLEHVIQKATELGAYEIVTFPSSRCIAKLTDKDKVKKLERWQKIAASAAEQSGRGKIPDVIILSSYKDALRHAVDSSDKAILFYENETAVTLHMALENKLFSSISLITGPEGGLDPAEVTIAKELGVEICTLGKRILRCETAPLCALSAVMYATGEF